MVFNISGTKESADTNPRREWVWLDKVRTLQRAKQEAKKLSKSRAWFEIEIEGFDSYFEKTHHSYWRNGKLEIDLYV